MTITGKNRKKRKLGQAFFVKKTHTVAKPSLQNMVKELLGVPKKHQEHQGASRASTVVKGEEPIFR